MLAELFQGQQDGLFDDEAEQIVETERAEPGIRPGSDHAASGDRETQGSYKGKPIGRSSRVAMMRYPAWVSAERITVRLPPDVLAGARGAVSAGVAESLSALVVDALRDRLSRTHALSELTRVLGGPPPLEARAAVRRNWGLPGPPTHLA